MKKKKWIFIVVIILVVVFAVIYMAGLPMLSRFQIESAYAAYESVPEVSDGANESEIWEETSSTLLQEEAFLEVSGAEIVNQKGETIVLEGTNLGGWLVQEYWMCPVTGDSDSEQWTQTETIQVLAERFGEEKAQELLKIYQDNWITEWDIQNIASMGCNVIRVPFGYWNFMSDAEGVWLTEEPDENPGFQRLDWLLETAEKYGVYVILDMHGCPGGQTDDHCDGTPGSAELFSNSLYQDVMEKLWVAIAKRYKDSPVVAAYDIMKDPREFESTVEEDPRNQLYDRIIRAIREVDSNHIIAVEGIWRLSKLPDPEAVGWENVIYEVHPYSESDTESYCSQAKQYAQTHQVPVYIGEFSNMDMIESCRKYGVSFTSWTYKGTGFTGGTWFVYCSTDAQAVDVYNDPDWYIELKWGNCLRTQFFTQVSDSIMDRF